MHTLFEEQAERTPDAVAVVYGDAQLTYGQLDGRANQLARLLSARGARPDLRVGLWVTRAVDSVVGLLGILKSGGVCVPLDPSHPAERLSLLLEGTAAALLVTQTALLERLPAGPATRILLDGDLEEIARQSDKRPARRTGERDLAYLATSSGATDRPLGVLMEHRSLEHFAEVAGQSFDLGSEARVLQLAPPGSEAWLWEIVTALMAGATLCIPEHALRPGVALSRALRQHRISALVLHSSALSRQPVADLPELGTIITTGDPCPRELLERWASNRRFFHVYGPAECAWCATISEWRPNGGPPSIGSPVDEVQAYVLDGALNVVPIGIPGELYLGGAGLARGYLDRSELTQERFIPDPFSRNPGPRLFRTGDRARLLDDGQLELLGRSDLAQKPPDAMAPATFVLLDALPLTLAGDVDRAALPAAEVAWPEVEAALLEQPSVEDCAVRLRRTETLEPQLVAYVVSSDPLSSERLQADLRARLPGHPVPTTYVPITALPLTAGGHVDEGALQGLEVIDEELVNRWEKQLQAVPGIGEAAVLVHERSERRSLLHLADLLPAGSMGGFLDQGTEPAAAVPTAAAETVASPDPTPARMALSDGGPLHIAEGTPLTLSAALRRLAAVGAGKGITYVQTESAGRFQSYAVLWEQARSVLTGLSRAGLGPGDRVILHSDSIEELLTTFWACILGGITPAIVAVAPSYQTQNSVVSKLYHSWELLERPPIVASERLIQPLLGLRSLYPMDGLTIVAAGALRENPPAEQIHDSSPGDVAYLQLTSGSTGTPKAIQETHRAIIHHILGSAQHNSYSDEVALNWLPYDHVVPLLMWHLRDVYLGHDQILVKTEIVLANPLAWLDLIEAHRVTNTWSPNFGYKLVNDAVRAAPDRSWDLSSIRMFVNGGEQVTFPVIRDFLSLLARSGVKLENMAPAFGMAETCTAMVYNNRFDLETGVVRVDKRSLNGALRAADADDPHALVFVHLGPPIPGVQVRIVDQNDQILPERTIGRLQIKGGVITPGYLNNPSANKDVFVGDGWFNSGDLGFLAEGRLVLTGREKETIVIRGANFYCYEIEDAINEIAGVEPTFAAACGINDPSTGTEALAIFFVPKDTSIQAQAKLAGVVRAEVTARIGLAPAVVVPLAKQDFAKTTSGKIQRIEMKRALEAGRFTPILKEIDLQLGNSSTLPDWFYRRSWRRKELRILADAPARGAWVIFVDDLGLGARLLWGLLSRAPRCVSVAPGAGFEQLGPDRFRIDPRSRVDYERLFHAVSGGGAPIEHVVHLWTYEHDAALSAGLEALERSQDRGMYSLLFLVQALASVRRVRARGEEEEAVRLTVVSSRTQPTGAADPVDPGKATMLGLLRTIPLELTWLRARHLDLEPGDTRTNAERVLGELDAPRGDREIAYRDGLRWTPVLARMDMLQRELRPSPIEPDGVYLVTGGLGGIGAFVAGRLIKPHRARVLLVGRTPLPPRSEWPRHMEEQGTDVGRKIRRYLELEALGGEVRYEVADVCDRARLTSVVAGAEEHWGRALSGVLHLAGELSLAEHWKGLDEHWILRETRDAFERLFRAKVYGTWTLNELVDSRPTAIFVAFSSVNSLMSGATLSAYAAASSFLDVHSLQRRHRGHDRTWCFNWSIWDAIGMSEGGQAPDRATYHAMGLEVIAREQGWSSLLAGLCRDETQLLVGLDGASPVIRRQTAAAPHGVHQVSACFTWSTEEARTNELGIPDLHDRFGTRVVTRIVEVSQIPRTDTGAVDRPALLAAIRVDRSVGGARVEPGTDVERRIAGIWREVLDLPEVSIHDNFFDLGGHSLRAMQVVSRLWDAFGVEVKLSALFAAPTVARLASAVEEALQVASQAETPAIARVPRTRSLPLSFHQERLWVIERLGLHFHRSMASIVARLRGRLDGTALARSLSEIVRRHEVLRTAFREEGGAVVQIVMPPGDLDLPVHDLSDLAPGERGGALKRMSEEELARPFDLETGRLLRATLFRLGQDEHTLLIAVHHISSDGPSMSIFIRELSDLYRAFATGEPPRLSELPVQYADFSVWQRDHLGGELLQDQLAYWRRQVERLSPLQLPTDRQRPDVPSSRGRALSFTLPEELSTAVQRLGLQHSATLYMTLLAALQVLLHRYTNQDSIAVGSLVANRSRPEIEGLIGYFVNPLVFCTSMHGDPGFVDLLARVRDVVLGALANQDVPFERLVEALNPERSLNRNPLFQVMLTYQEQANAAPRFNLHDCEGTVLPESELLSTATMDLEVRIWPDGPVLTGVWIYDTDLFDASSVQRMMANFQTLLSGIVAQPEQRISRLPLLAWAEREQVLTAWNATTVSFRMELCIHEMFERQVERTPDAIAVTFEGKQLTYRALNRLANGVAHRLVALGVGPEGLVGVFAERSFEMVIGLLGVLKAGGAYIPLDPSYPEERIRVMVEDARPRVILMPRSSRAGIPGQDIHIVYLDRPGASGAQEVDDNPRSGARLNDLAYVIYTSGSTGRPNGAMNTHAGLRNRLLWMQDALQLTSGDAVLQKTPYSFDVSVWEFFWPLMVGAELVVTRPEGHRDAAYLADVIAAHSITTAHFTPSMLQVFLEGRWLEKCPGLKRVVCSGEVLPFELTERFFAQCTAELYNLYGPTEASIDVTFWRCAREDARRIVPIGRPIANTRMYVLDRELAPTPVGVAGEMYIGGVGVGRGYINRPTLTAERFIEDPFAEGPGQRLYKTGDLGRWLPDGTLEYLGRIDHQVKIRGYRIELGEIESRLLQHPAIREVVVVAREDVPGDKRLVAYLVARDAASVPETAALREHLQGELPEFMVPTMFVGLGAMPLSPNGKVDRRALPAPGTPQAEPDGAVLPLRDIVELELARMWEDILAVRSVDFQDDFFALGGHSLLVVRLMQQIRERFGQALPTSTIFRAPTVQALARVLREGASPAPWTPLVAVQPSGKRRAFLCVHPLLGNVMGFVSLSRNMGKDRPFYGFQAQGLFDDQEVLTRVEDMASLYVEALRAVQPEGPYLLGGWSFGGVVALEMAKQLVRAGRPVELVALFDTMPPGVFFDALVQDDASVLELMTYEIALSMGLKGSPADPGALGVEARVSRACALLSRVGFLQPEFDEARVKAYILAQWEAFRKYEPSVPCRIALFRATEQMVLLRHAGSLPDFGEAWRAKSSFPVEVHDVPGSHITMMLEPHARTLAEVLRRCLLAADAEVEESVARGAR